MTAEFTLAIHALVYLQQRNLVTSSTVLAEDISTNPARVRMVMSKLHQAGLVDSTQGQHSGYRVNDKTAAATLAQILEALNETPVAMHWKSGDEENPSPTAIGLAEQLPQLYGEMNGILMEYLKDVTVGQLHDKIFK